MTWHNSYFIKTIEYTIVWRDCETRLDKSWLLIKFLTEPTVWFTVFWMISVAATVATFQFDQRTPSHCLFGFGGSGLYPVDNECTLMKNSHICIQNLLNTFECWHDKLILIYSWSQNPWMQHGKHIFMLRLLIFIKINCFTSHDNRKLK